MSNCYASYCTRIPYYTYEQQAWLATQIETQEHLHAAMMERRMGKKEMIWEPQAEDEDTWDFGDWNWLDPNGNDPAELLGYLELSGHESHQDDVAFLALIYNETFGCLNTRGWSMEVAFTDDWGTTNSFGGVAYAIYQGQTRFISTYDEISKFFLSCDHTERIINAWQQAIQQENMPAPHMLLCYVCKERATEECEDPVCQEEDDHVGKYYCHHYACIETAEGDLQEED